MERRKTVRRATAIGLSCLLLAACGNTSGGTKAATTSAPCAIVTKFGAAATSSATGDNPRAVVGAELNGDGKPDLVVADLEGNAVSVLLGNGDGTFRAAAEYRTSAVPVAITAVDLTGDGRAELLAPVPNAGAVAVFVATPSGAFEAAVEVRMGTGAYDALAADLTGDGAPDLISANSAANSIQVRPATC